VTYEICEMPQWIEVEKRSCSRMWLRRGTAAKIGEQKSDSPNLAEMMMSLEEAQPSTDYQPNADQS
jgi:hypothetical protein